MDGYSKTLNHRKILRKKQPTENQTITKTEI